jgi:hypothetical protein
MRLLPIRRLFGANRRGLVKGPASVTGTKHLLDDGSWSAVTATGIAASEAEALAGVDITKFINASTLRVRALQGDMTRPVKSTLFSDGATSNRRGEATPGTAGAVAALPVSFPFEFDVSTSNPSASCFISAIADSATGPNNANNLFIQLTSAGSLAVQQSGATASDYRSLQWSAFRTTYSGLRIRGMVVFASPNTTTNPVIYINGADVSASFSLVQNGTPPNWMPTTLNTTKFVSGLNWAAGRFVPHAPILGALTADEVLTWTVTGRLPTWCEVGVGSAVAEYASNFAVDADGWTQNIADANLQVTGNVDAVSGVDDVMKAYANGGAKTFQLSRLATTLITGAAYEMSFDYYAEASAFTAGATLGLRSWGSRYSLPGGGGYSSVTIVAGSWQTGNKLIFVVPAASPTLGLSAYGSAATDVGTTLGSGKAIYFKNIVLRRLGPIAKWPIRSGRVLPDLSGNKIPLVLYSGVFPITDDHDGVVTQSALTANGELVDTTGCAPRDATLIDVVVKNTSANKVYGFALASTSGGDELTYRTDIPAGETVVLAIKRADLAALTAGSYAEAGSTYGRLYYSATSWNSGSLNVSVRYRRERGI